MGAHTSRARSAKPSLTAALGRSQGLFLSIQHSDTKWDAKHILDQNGGGGGASSKSATAYNFAV